MFFAKAYYTPPEPSLWRGRDDGFLGERYFQRVTCFDLTSNLLLTQQNPKIGFLGFAVDEGVKRNQGRSGAKEGPRAIRSLLGNLCCHFKAGSLLDLGDIVCHDDNLEAAQKALCEAIGLCYAKGIFPIIFGGGHETAWGHYQGLIKHPKHRDCQIVNFDAHFDMRPLLPQDKGSSGTSFLQIANFAKAKEIPFFYTTVGIQPTANTERLFETAKNFNVQIISAQNIHTNLGLLQTVINQIVTEHEAIYITICLDVFASSFAPGVSAPSPIGLMPFQVISALQQLAASGKVIAFDIVELAPNYDINHQTAQLAAICVAEFLHAYK